MLEIPVLFTSRLAAPDLGHSPSADKPVAVVATRRSIGASLPLLVAINDLNDRFPARTAALGRDLPIDVMSVSGVKSAAAFGKR